MRDPFDEDGHRSGDNGRFPSAERRRSGRERHYAGEEAHCSGEENTVRKNTQHGGI